ncbi:MAG TPA: membrane dipeptidase, partial [Xanthomonadales bacterium]|nr:membrane dipeptidase [Xanthomonadales bacterium]
GIMVDISHVSDEAFYDALAQSKVPMIASHSSARHFTPGFERNLSDEMIQALAKNGGVIQINFASSFLTREANEWQIKFAAARTAWQEETGNTADSEAANEWSKAYREESPFPYASITEVADHIDHAVKLTSYQHVGIGSDFDGVGDSLPVGLKDVSTYPALIAELLRRGYTEEQLIAILGGNTLRVWQQVEDYANSQRTSLDNPAAVYCQHLGGQQVNGKDESGGASSLCQLVDGQSCEQWGLYRGSCTLQAEITDPFAYCSATVNTPVLPATIDPSRPMLPQVLLAPMRAHGLAQADQPVEVQGAARWRCMDSAVYVCPIGANLPCSEPANLSQTPNPAMQEYCVANPAADAIPAYITGRATVYQWGCADGIAVTGKQQFNADAQGYLAEFWHRLDKP